MSIKALSEILIYKEMKELYTEEERIKLKKELRKSLSSFNNNFQVEQRTKPEKELEQNFISLDNHKVNKKIKVKKKLRRNLPISMNNISEVIIKIIDKINES